MRQLDPTHYGTLYNHGPILIGIGLAVVLIAQWWPVVPIAAAIALIGLGATLTLASQRQQTSIMLLNAATYMVLMIWVGGMQLHAREHIAIFADILVAGALTLITARVTVSDF